jgi:hypothetical protein
MESEESGAAAGRPEQRRREAEDVVAVGRRGRHAHTAEASGGGDGGDLEARGSAAGQHSGGRCRRRYMPMLRSAWPPPYPLGPAEAACRIYSASPKRRDGGTLCGRGTRNG